MILRFSMALGLSFMLVFGGGMPAWATEFGCDGHEFSTSMPSVEGRDGFFFRTFADLRMQHPLTDEVADQLGRLTEALAENGTTLVYAAIPSKSQAMPEYLPDRSLEYSYDVDIAAAVYLDIIARLDRRGLTAPDIQSALRDAGAGSPAFFRADFHWTPEGARQAAKAIGAAIRGAPEYVGVTPSEFKSRVQGPATAFSGMRRALQTFCQNELPRVKTQSWITEKVASDATAEGSTNIDIFSSDEDSAQAVLVGTSFSDSDINNFAGFISEYSGLDVVNYAITGGNQFGAITSYLTSAEFSEQRPLFLIWENPVYNNLAQYGPGHLEELIAAASGKCTERIATAVENERTLVADLNDASLRPGDLVFADFGREGVRRAEFQFHASNGLVRRATIKRVDRLRATGRFYQSLQSIWSDDISQVSVTFDRPVDDATTLSICRLSKDDPS